MSARPFAGQSQRSETTVERNGGMSCMPIAKLWERFNADEPAQPRALPGTLGAPHPGRFRWKLPAN